MGIIFSLSLSLSLGITTSLDRVITKSFYDTWMKMEERKRYMCVERKREKNAKSTDSLFHLFQLSRLDHSIRYTFQAVVQYISTANSSIVGHHYPEISINLLRDPWKCIRNAATNKAESYLSLSIQENCDSWIHLLSENVFS